MACVLCLVSQSLRSVGCNRLSRQGIKERKTCLQVRELMLDQKKINFNGRQVQICQPQQKADNKVYCSSSPDPRVSCPVRQQCNKNKPLLLFCSLCYVYAFVHYSICVGTPNAYPNLLNIY